MPTSVVEALKAQEYYKASGRIEEQMLKTITPTGETQDVGDGLRRHQNLRR